MSGIWTDDERRDRMTKKCREARGKNAPRRTPSHEPPRFAACASLARLGRFMAVVTAVLVPQVVAAQRWEAEYGRTWVRTESGAELEVLCSDEGPWVYYRLAQGVGVAAFRRAIRPEQYVNVLRRAIREVTFIFDDQSVHREEGYVDHTYLGPPRSQVIVFMGPELDPDHIEFPLEFVRKDRFALVGKLRAASKVLVTISGYDGADAFELEGSDSAIAGLECDGPRARP